MSDLPPGIRERVARDRRWQQVRLAVDIETELRDSKVVQVILDVLQQDADECMDRLVETAAGDTALICQLQARITHWRLAKKALRYILEAGKNAEESLREEDSVSGDGVVRDY